MPSDLTQPPHPTWWKRLVLPAAISLAAILPYLGVFDAPYVFDDVKLVKENRLLREAWGDWGRVAESRASGDWPLPAEAGSLVDRIGA